MSHSHNDVKLVDHPEVKNEGDSSGINRHYHYDVKLEDHPEVKVEGDSSGIDNHYHSSRRTCSSNFDFKRQLQNPDPQKSFQCNHCSACFAHEYVLIKHQ